MKSYLPIFCVSATTVYSSFTWERKPQITNILSLIHLQKNKQIYLYLTVNSILNKQIDVPDDKNPLQEIHTRLPAEELWSSFLEDWEPNDPTQRYSTIYRGIIVINYTNSRQSLKFVHFDNVRVVPYVIRLDENWAESV